MVNLMLHAFPEVPGALRPVLFVCLNADCLSDENPVLLEHRLLALLKLALDVGKAAVRHLEAELRRLSRGMPFASNLSPTSRPLQEPAAKADFVSASETMHMT